MKYKYVKIFGERNTGTNYLSKLIISNFQVQELRGTVPKWPLMKSEYARDLYFRLTHKYNFGWKYSIVNEDILKSNKKYKDTLFLFLVKNPYSFLLSLHRRPYHNEDFNNLRFGEFINTKWQARSRDSYLNKNFNNPVELWNTKNHSYYNFYRKNTSNSLLIKYEDLLANNEVILDEISMFLEKRDVDYKYVNESTKGDESKYEDYKDYYLKEKWRDKLDKEHFILINNKLDSNLAEKLKYVLL